MTTTSSTQSSVVRGNLHAYGLGVAAGTTAALAVVSIKAKLITISAAALLALAALAAAIVASGYTIVKSRGAKLKMTAEKRKKDGKMQVVVIPSSPNTKFQYDHMEQGLLGLQWNFGPMDSESVWDNRITRQ